MRARNRQLISINNIIYLQCVLSDIPPAKIIDTAEVLHLRDVAGGGGGGINVNNTMKIPAGPH